MPARELLLFLSAVVAGLAVTAPPGPAGALCVTRTLRGGLRDGLTCGIGVALGDGVLGAIAAVAVVSLAAPDPRVGRAVALVAAPVLAYLGVRFLGKAVRALRADGGANGAGTDGEDTAARGRLLRAGGTFLLALTTPGTAPGLAVLFTALGMSHTLEPTVSDVSVVALGVTAGGMIWWLAVLTLADRFRQRALRYVGWMDATAGAALLLASIVAARAAIG